MESRTWNRSTEWGTAGDELIWFQLHVQLFLFFFLLCFSFSFLVGTVCVSAFILGEKFCTIAKF